MKKSKISGDIAVMGVSHQSTMGSRTRAAKTLALQRLSKTTPSGSPATGVGLNPDVSSFSYLQLRNRRLEKLASPVSNKMKQRQEGKESSFREGEKKNGGKNSEGCFGNREIVVGVGICRGTTEEACFGGELRDRNTRESSSCGLIKDFETIAAPVSTTKPRTSPLTHRRGPGNDVQRSIVAAQEMEGFFAFAEQQQQRQFMEKYNFDIVNDLPLPGRYEWVKMIP
ncbi:Detected protein of unknown function [Hibiscus syriacus]|uniref:Cyclin-dependent kinase inhibitor domain-containing protein n=1 Tax=Hibiscus syriacus TaxID=106335 RepID=A0A6A2YYS7_HIBSY|nr:cyclin-dependent kinase inhibitor 3-like [Hibiscus syriacus]KAE8684606.1 Detected protein of unknown function [Hibiscus syriacus]